MGLRAALGIAAATRAVELAADAPAPVAAPRSSAQLVPALEARRTVTRRAALQVPAVKAAVRIVTTTPATFRLRAWQGDDLAAAQPAWLANPDPRQTPFALIARTLDDLVWHDVAYWVVTRRGADGYPLAFRRVDPARVAELPNPGDPDAPPELYIDGRPPAGRPVILADGRILDPVVRIDGAGVGGLARDGSPLAGLALDLIDAAARYARSPLPTTVLRNASEIELGDDEIDAMLDDYERARATRATAYVDNLEIERVGWSAAELQLVEAREHAALEVARLFGIPARYVQAAVAGTSMTYTNTIEVRRDLVEALRPWTAPLEQALTLYAAPRGTDIRLDFTAFIRDDAQTRMGVWSTAIAAGVLTAAEARAAEPLAPAGELAP